MRHLTASLLVLLCTCSSAAWAGQRPPSPGTSPPPREVPLPRTPPPRTEPVRDEDRKQAQAVRVESGSIRLDGRLDDEAWQRTIPVTDFVQAEPVERASTTDHMEIRFVYDDTALWIGARMDSSGGIQAPMSRRDDGDRRSTFKSSWIRSWTGRQYFCGENDYLARPVRT